MKKTLIALAAVAATGAAFAQSSVTMFGIVDMALTSIDEGGQSETSLANEGQMSNRIGFRGVEDLGGGLSAEFWLEAGFSGDTGVGATSATNTALSFNRRSTLGVKGGFGEVRLGRDYTPTFSNHSAYTVFGTNGLGNSLNTFGFLDSGATTGVRANNAISYFTPNISGFTGHLMVGLKEDAAANTPNEYTGLRLAYNAGPLSASLATASEGATIGEVDSYKRTNLGVTYDFGVAKVFFFHVNGKFGDLKNKQTALGVTAPVGPGTAKLSYLKASYNAAATAADAADDDATHITVGYDYPLSKRTVVYGVYSRVSNDGQAEFSVNYGGSGAASTGTAAGGSSSGFAVGVRHTF
jgi:predicted porin